jgi:uncharacterized protein
VKLSDITDPTSDALLNARAYVSDLAVPTVRLGVTGLARAGKTVFITALVRNLIAGGRLPFFRAAAEGRLISAHLQPQPDDAVPRFTYEDHLGQLAANPPVWPESTRRISQLRLTLTYQPQSRIRRALDSTLGSSRLHVDIVDYPGEWLVDLALLDADYTTWSAQSLADAASATRRQHANAFQAFIAALPSNAPADEQCALKGADLFTGYLSAARAATPLVATLGPGRFLMPGDLAGSPLLTFLPLPRDTATQSPALAAMLERRYESYKAHVVKPFFRDHFSRLDRQIVLVDALAALDQGREGLADLSRAMDHVLKAFRPGANTWLSSIFRRRVDRILFAATKADHLNHQSHDRLEALLNAIARDAIARASFAGADVKTLAIAGLRATREAEATIAGEALPCIIGTPLAGERVENIVFDGKTETALFPGDLPADPTALLNGDVTLRAGHEADVRVLRFAPPRITLETSSGTQPALPHIRLDRAIDFLIGDRLA